MKDIAPAGHPPNSSRPANCQISIEPVLKNDLLPLVGHGYTITGPDSRQTIGQEKSGWITKQQIAKHFQASPRTITNWMQKRVLPVHRLGGLVRFNASECDGAFEKFKCASTLNGKVAAGLCAHRSKTWKTKEQVARHFNCSYRTVGNLMCRRVLPFVKLGNVVRFDLDECDAIMRRLKTASIFESGN